MTWQVVSATPFGTHVYQEFATYPMAMAYQAARQPLQTLRMTVRMAPEPKPVLQMSTARNHGFYVHEPCTNDPYRCDCDDCADERDLDRARRTPEGETL